MPIASSPSLLRFHSSLLTRAYPRCFVSAFKMSKNSKIHHKSVSLQEENDRVNMACGDASLKRLQNLFTPKPISATKVLSMHSAITEGNEEYMKGGEILSRIDLVATQTIRKLGGLFMCPTRSMDGIHFLAPVPRGSLVIYKAQINRVWNSSLEVAVTVEVDNGKNPSPTFCCSSLLTFVLVRGPLDDQGKRRLTQVYPEDLVQKRDFDLADLRRSARLSEDSKTESRCLALFRPYILGGLASENPSYCEMTEVVLPTHANDIQSTFGGQLMKWMEACAAISASRLVKGNSVLSVSSDSLQFIKPSRVGDALILRSIVTRSFSTSMEVYVTVTRLGHGSDIEEFSNEGFFTFVATGDVILSPLVPNEGPETSIYDSAFLRRDRRLANLKALVPPKL